MHELFNRSSPLGHRHSLCGDAATACCPGTCAPVSCHLSGDQSFLTTAVGSAARSLTYSPARSGGRPVIAAPPSFSFYVGSLKASLPSIWQTSWASIAPTCWSDGTPSIPWWPCIFSPTEPLSDPVTEADELYQNAGEKGRLHAELHDPPRRRANQARGHGTWDSDRPTIIGIVGRRNGQIRLRLCHHSDRATLEPLVLTHTRRNAIINTDEWSAYGQLAATGRIHQTVCHTPGQREWARDDE